MKKTLVFSHLREKGLIKEWLVGFFMIAIAVLWFVGGYTAGYIFYYPPILGLIGIYAVIKGLATCNFSGEKSELRSGNNITSSYQNDHSVNKYQGMDITAKEAQKSYDDGFCPECGEIIDKELIKCLACGADLSSFE